jgi:hypothetical protein
VNENRGRAVEQRSMTGLTLRRASERDRPSGGAPAVAEPKNERQNQVQPAAQGHASRRPDTPRTETRTDDDGTRPGGALREKPVGKAAPRNPRPAAQKRGEAACLLPCPSATPRKENRRRAGKKRNTQFKNRRSGGACLEKLSE